MNAEKLKLMQSEVRIGGKGTQRRKKKIVHTTTALDDKKLNQTLKKLSLNALVSIKEVNIIKTDGTVLHIRNAKAQGAVAINTFAITGNSVEKTIVEMLPGILPQLGPKDLQGLKKSAENYDYKSDIDDVGDIKTQVFNNIALNDEDDVPCLIDDFEALAMGEVNTEDKEFGSEGY